MALHSDEVLGSLLLLHKARPARTRFISTVESGARPWQPPKDLQCWGKEIPKLFPSRARSVHWGKCADFHFSAGQVTGPAGGHIPH